MRLRECFHGPHGIAPTAGNVLGVLSLVFWSLFIVISVKYLIFVMRADNRGEGGILALMSLIRPNRDGARGVRWLLVMLGIFGAALLYGDGIITPAISVLSARGGASDRDAASFTASSSPSRSLILIGLFLLQKVGTGRVGRIFGPVMMLWFAVHRAPRDDRRSSRLRESSSALDPREAVRFFESNGRVGFLVLGAVFLVVTGGEALYADMGHFGARPIRIAWFTVVLPGLLLNYFGQGALLLQNPEAAQNPFYLLGPRWTLYPMVALSTFATVIASQAVISGAFSLTRQAVLLGYCPRLGSTTSRSARSARSTFPRSTGLLMVATIALVLGFRSSSQLAAAYGVAVTTTMAITTILMAVVARELWKWPVAGARRWRPFS